MFEGATLPPRKWERVERRSTIARMSDEKKSEIETPAEVGVVTAVEPKIDVPTNTWMNNPQYLAQVGHFFGGFSIITLTAIFFGFGMPIVYAALGVVVAAGIKEFWYDRNYEIPKQTNADDLMDWTFYQVGSAIGVVVMWLAHHLHRIL